MFSGKQKLTEFSTTKPTLQKVKGTHIVKTYKRLGEKKKNLQSQPETIKKIVTGTFSSVQSFSHV